MIEKYVDAQHAHFHFKEGRPCGQPSGAEAPAEMSVQHRSETDWATAQTNAFASVLSLGLFSRSVPSNMSVRKRVWHLYLVQ